MKPNSVFISTFCLLYLSEAFNLLTLDKSSDHGIFWLMSRLLQKPGYPSLPSLVVRKINFKKPEKKMQVNKLVRWHKDKYLISKEKTKRQADIEEYIQKYQDLEEEPVTFKSLHIYNYMDGKKAIKRFTTYKRRPIDLITRKLQAANRPKRSNNVIEEENLGTTISQYKFTGQYSLLNQNLAFRNINS